MNTKNRYRILLTLCALLTALATPAQRRQIGDARTILKSGKNFDKAEKLMTDLLKNPANQENTRIYDIWLQSVEKQYAQMNEKMYMKQKIDTAAFFNLTRRCFTIAERLDSLDARPDKKGRVDPQYRESVSRRLLGYRPNLFYGGAFHLRKSDFKTAYDYFEMYIDCSRQPLFEAHNLTASDNLLGEAAYWATYCGYRLSDPVLTLRYQGLARLDTAKLEHTLQYVCEAWHMLGDEDGYVGTLREGFEHFPQSQYFFPRLVDSYTSKGNYKQALAVSEEALKTDSASALFLLAQTTALFNLERYADCLRYSDRLIAVDPDNADAYYYAGSSCLNIALRMDPRKYKKQIRRMYQRAQPFMETYRSLRPDDKERWGPCLYRIYFYLNLGKQFDEIDQILKK